MRLRNDGRFDLVIVDEANAYKTSTTKRWKSLQKIVYALRHIPVDDDGHTSIAVPCGCVWACQVREPQWCATFYTAWRDQVMNKITMFKWAPKADAPQTVHALQPAIRFTKAQCLDLPPVITMVREVPLTPQQNKYYTCSRADAGTGSRRDNHRSQRCAGVSKLLQISCGAAYTDMKETVEFDSTPRLAVLEELERPIARSSSSRCSAHHLPSATSSPERHRHGEIHGGITATKRGDIIKRFQTSPNPGCWSCSLQRLRTASRSLLRTP
jgi:hypothetical protein